MIRFTLSAQVRMTVEQVGPDLHVYCNTAWDGRRMPPTVIPSARQVEEGVYETDTPWHALPGSNANPDTRRRHVSGKTLDIRRLPSPGDVFILQIDSPVGWANIFHADAYRAGEKAIPLYPAHGDRDWAMAEAARQVEAGRRVTNNALPA
jgi:hypothetical protein